MKARRFGFFVRLEKKSKQISAFWETQRRSYTSNNPQPKQVTNHSLVHLGKSAIKRLSNSNMSRNSGRSDRKTLLFRNSARMERYSGKTPTPKTISGQHRKGCKYVADLRCREKRNRFDWEKNSKTRNQSAPVSKVNISRIIESHLTTNHKNNPTKQNLTNPNGIYLKHSKIFIKRKIKIRNKHRMSENLNCQRRRIDKCHLDQDDRHRPFQIGLLDYTIKVNKIFSNFKMNNKREIFSLPRTNCRKSRRDSDIFTISKESIWNGTNFGSYMNRNSKTRRQNSNSRVNYRKNRESQIHKDSNRNFIANTTNDSVELDLTRRNEELKPNKPNTPIIKSSIHQNSKICKNGPENEEFGLSIHRKEILKPSDITMPNQRTEQIRSPKVIQHLAEIRQAVSLIKPSLSFFRVNENEIRKFEIKRVLGVGKFAVVKLMERKTDGKQFAGKFLKFKLFQSRGFTKNTKVIEFKLFVKHTPIIFHTIWTILYDNYDNIFCIC